MMKSTIPYLFHDKVIFRSPIEPLEVGVEEDNLLQFFLTQEGSEMLYLASPPLYAALQKWQADPDHYPPKAYENLVSSLYKYYMRVHSRCTPFGLFSGVGVAKWGQQNNLEVGANRCSRKTRLDMTIQIKLAQRIIAIPYVRQYLNYFPNSTLYHFADELRYIEYHDKSADNRVHQIASVTRTVYLEKLLKVAKRGATIDELTQSLSEDTRVGIEEAYEFIEELIRAQVLVHELEPNVTGSPFFSRIFKVVFRIAQQDSRLLSILELLQRLEEQLALADQKIGNKSGLYQEILRLLEQLHLPTNQRYLFQADMVHNAENHCLDQKWQQPLLEGLWVLKCLSVNNGNPQLDRFKKSFMDRYEGKEVPLLQLFDKENGIAYGNSQLDEACLTRDLAIPTFGKSRNVNMEHPVEQWKQEQLAKAQVDKAYEVSIEKSMLNRFCTDEHAFGDLPTSFSLIFRLLDEDKIYLENVGNASACNLIGRFAHAHSDLNEALQEVADEEQKIENGGVLAEIAHLPGGRVGNILQRPGLRKHVIPCLVNSGVGEEQEIPLSDLVVAVVGNEIILRSQKLNKRIIPRLSAAHNFRSNALPIYQFLCDLQYQGLSSSIGFNWGDSHPRYTFLPRLRFKNVILFPATWQFSDSDFKEVFRSGNNAISRFRVFCNQYRIPKLFYLVEGDRDLLIDTENPRALLTFFREIKHKKSIELREFLPPQRVIVTGDQHRSVANQFVASLLRTEPVYSKKIVLANRPSTDVQQRFTVGSEWLYYKLYTGPGTADQLLLGPIADLISELESLELIDQWFFVRYTDPEFHVRLRLHLKNPQNAGAILPIFESYFAKYVDQELIWKVQIDTYIREIGRYGTTGMIASEALFYQDSRLCTSVLSALGERSDEDWVWLLRSIDQFLEAFALTLSDKIRLVGVLKESFANEFNTSKSQRQTIAKKYRKYTPLITTVFSDQHPDSIQLQELFSQRTQAIQSWVEYLKNMQRLNRLEVAVNQLISSHIHMMINRWITNYPRKHELVLYDFLFRHYQSEQARAKQSKKTAHLVMN